MAKRQDAALILFDKLTSVKFKLQGKAYEIDMGGELLVGEEDIHSQTERIPAVLGYFGSIVALLEKEYENKKDLKKSLEAKIDKKIREQGLLGEARIDKAIKRHPKWLEICVSVNSSKERYVRSKNLYESLKEKSIVLISRSSDIRNIPGDSIRGVNREDVIRS